MKAGISRWLFNQIQSRNLIYNQCWEDPALDQEVLNIQASDHLVMITSAGCNALDYLLKDPAEIVCVDMNPHQNALLDLKLAAIEALSYEQFFEMFGKGRIRGHAGIYKTRLRDRLSPRSREIWDRRIGYFDPRGSGLYFHGTAGWFARAVRWYLHSGRGLRSELDAFQQIRTQEVQAEFYRQHIAPKLWSPVVRVLMGRTLVLALLGVPAEQIRQIQLSSGLLTRSFVEERVERTLTRLPIESNYFWRLYLNGYYPEGCCPNYLKPEHFDNLRRRVSKVRIHTTTLTEFLKSTEEQFSVFVLLDHMDWILSAPQVLEEEWRAIMERAVSGARIIYRSGSSGTFSRRYIPEFAARRLEFQPGRTAELHDRDRVGTYASFHFATVMP